MIEVGAFHAKTHLSSLLTRVARGEKVLITRRGVPVARLVPAEREDRSRIEEAVDRLRELRKGAQLRGMDWKELRDRGRR